MSRMCMIHHINIQITDRQQTRDWYEKVLGAEFLDRGPALNKRQLQLRIGTAEIHSGMATSGTYVQDRPVNCCPKFSEMAITKVPLSTLASPTCWPST